MCSRIFVEELICFGLIGVVIGGEVAMVDYCYCCLGLIASDCRRMNWYCYCYTVFIFFFVVVLVCETVCVVKLLRICILVVCIFLYIFESIGNRGLYELR
jgi:hypothetical protein